MCGLCVSLQGRRYPMLRRDLFVSILSSKPGAHGCYGFAGGVGLRFLESGGYDPY